MGKMKKVLICAGVRPEWIKLVSTIKELKKQKNIKTIVINTGQHAELTDRVLKLFKIKPDYDLKIMKRKQPLTDIMKMLLIKLTPVILKENPDIIISFADTSTALGTALIAFYNKIPIFHMEGGGRSYEKYNPYPEEISRRLIDHVSEWTTCQTRLDMSNLRKEGIFNTRFVGNYSLDVIKKFAKGIKTKKQILVTMHRREGWGAPMKAACSAIKTLAKQYPNYNFMVLRHPNPIVFNTITKSLNGIKNVHLLNNLPFDQFIRLMASSKLIMTDSGGTIQEALFLRKPIVHLRKLSEYESEEEIDKDYFISTDKNKNKIIKAVKILLEKNTTCGHINIFGNGTAGKQTVEWIKEILQVKK